MSGLAWQHEVWELSGNTALCNKRATLLQAKLLPADKVQLKVYSVSTHRLARYLDSTEQLLPIVRGTLLQEMGFSSGHIRLHNLV